MACLNTLKQEIRVLESAFPKTNELFQVVSASVDELTCRFISKTGKKYDIHANITVSIRGKGGRASGARWAWPFFSLLVFSSFLLFSFFSVCRFFILAVFPVAVSGGGGEGGGASGARTWVLALEFCSFVYGGQGGQGHPPCPLNSPPVCVCSYLCSA